MIRIAKTFSDIIKFNPYHGPDGRFTSAGAAASFTYRPGVSAAHDKAINRERERTAASAAISTTAAQQYTSAETSINSSKLPAVFSKVDWKPGTVNFDNGGGKFDNATEYLSTKGVKNLIYDPYNRSQEHNQSVVQQISQRKADTATISNVLNVIQEKDARLEVLRNTKQALKDGGRAYITIYEGNRSGNGAPSSKGYQLNRKTADYLPEVQEVFPDARVHRGMIVAINSQPGKSFQQLIQRPAAVGKSFSDILKFNPYHDSLGRFTGPGAAVFFTTQTRDPKKQHMADMAAAREKERQAAAGAAAGGNSEWNDTMDKELETILSKKPSKQALYLLDNGMLSYDDAVEAMDNGTTEPHLRNYFAIMKQNGDPTSTKPLAENRTGRNRDVDSGKYASHDEAKKEYIKEMSGMNDAEAEKVSKEITTWTSNSWDKADTATIDKYIEKDHTFKGEIYRGMSFSDEDYASFMKDLAPGSEISMRRNSSWSSNEDDARIFAHTGQDDVNSIMIKCVKNRTSSPIAYLNSQGEEEVIAHSKAKWTVLQSETRETRTGHKKTYLTVVEKGEGG